MTGWNRERVLCVVVIGWKEKGWDDNKLNGVSTDKRLLFEFDWNLDWLIEEEEVEVVWKEVEEQEEIHGDNIPALVRVVVVVGGNRILILWWLSFNKPVCVFVTTKDKLIVSKYFVFIL